MKIIKGRDCYPLPDDWDREIQVGLLALVSSPDFQAVRTRNPDTLAYPVIGCVIKGFDDPPFNRLYVWPIPIADWELQVMYMPCVVGRSI